AYLVSMTLRIAEIQRVLKPTGSFYLHCDPTASHYLKLILDAIFCAKGGNYISEITWERTSAHADSHGYANTADIIFLYSKSSQSLFNQQFRPYSEEYIRKYYKHKDQQGRFLDRDLTAAGLSGGGYEYTWNNVKRIWRCPVNTMEKYEAAGRLYYTKNGTPRLKQYLDEMSGVPLTNVWTDIPPINSQAAERLGYPTQKPEALLERIIKASSNENDVILDAYCGCGTTVAVAEKLKRQWIGIDITYQSISLILKRLEDQQPGVLDNIEINGVPKDFDSAVALANKTDDRTRKEFEKWMVLTYSRNQAVINDKKGGDAGIDGIAYIPDRNDKGDVDNRKVLFSVKSSAKLSPAIIRELNGTIERENAACGILLTLYPMPNLVKDSKQYGSYYNKLVARDYPKIQVVSVAEIFGGKLLELPNVVKVLKDAEQHLEQIGLLNEE
ncbi:MAG: DNA methyltransferase, partial [Thiotrichaceae bacterium]